VGRTLPIITSGGLHHCRVALIAGGLARLLSEWRWWTKKKKDRCCLLGAMPGRAAGNLADCLRGYFERRLRVT